MAATAICYTDWQLNNLKTVLQQKSKAVVVPVAMSATCRKKFVFDEYSVTMYQRFCCITCLWLHSGFAVSATGERSVVLPVRVYECPTRSCGKTVKIGRVCFSTLLRSLSKLNPFKMGIRSAEFLPESSNLTGFTLLR